MNNYLSQFSGFSGIRNQGFGVVDPMRARAEQMRVGLANSGINGVPEASLTGAARTQSPPVILDEGKSYFLKQDTALRDRLMATERESARRGNRPVQGVAPTYNYETAAGERFRGTFLGDGSYGGFGRFATDRQGNRLSKYSPRIMESRAAKGMDPYAAESTGVFVSREGQRGPATEPWQQREGASRIQQSPESSMGMTGSPLSFTRFGQMSGIAPQPSATIAPPAQSPFDRNRLNSLNGFGGAPLFPYS